MNVNKGEHGVDLRIDFREVVTGLTVELILKDPCGNESVKTAVIGTTTETDEFIGAITANQWIYYTLTSTDLDEAGRWQMKGVAKDGTTSKRSTDWLPLEVRA